MLKIAITKGRVEEKFCELMKKAGYDIEPIVNKDRKLLIKTKDNIEAVFVKANNVLTFIETGTVDIGIVGKDTLLESENKNYLELIDLETGNCKFALAAYPSYRNKEFVAKKKIATKYPKIAKQYFEKKNEDVEIIKLDGSVELGPIVGLSDAIVDIVETGNTLKANGLEVIENICDISTRLIANKSSLEFKNTEINNFVNKLNLEIRRENNEKYIKTNI